MIQPPELARKLLLLLDAHKDGLLGGTFVSAHQRRLHNLQALLTVLASEPNRVQDASLLLDQLSKHKGPVITDFGWSFGANVDA